MDQSFKPFYGKHMPFDHQLGKRPHAPRNAAAAAAGTRVRQSDLPLERR